MKLRTILLVLSLLASISTAVGGFYYFFSLQEREFNRAGWRAAARTEVIRDQLGSYLAGNLKSVRALAGLDEIGRALERPDQESLAWANQRLDHFKESLEVDVCYLMDLTGLVLASSNRNDPDSFVGDNFGFRPYFKEAAQGRAGKYLALGLTSRKRGAYCSYPVRTGRNGEIAGVAVIKASIRAMENEVIGSFEGITLLTGPHDIIFSSNRPQWLFGTLWRKTPWQAAQVAESRQFGQGPWDWIGFTRKSSRLAADEEGNEYIVFSKELRGYPEWNVVHLEILQPVSATVLRPPGQDHRPGRDRPLPPGRGLGPVPQPQGRTGDRPPGRRGGGPAADPGKAGALLQGSGATGPGEDPGDNQLPDLHPGPGLHEGP